MSSDIIPTGGELRLHPQDDPEPAGPPLLFDIEIPVRFELTSKVGRPFFPGDGPTTNVSLEDVDLGVSKWRELAGKEVIIPEEADQSDAAIYLATVHNPVYLRRIKFGKAGRKRIPAVIELELDFSCVNPRPPELPEALSVRWEIDFKIVEEEE